MMSALLMNLIVPIVLKTWERFLPRLFPKHRERMSKRVRRG